MVPRNTYSSKSVSIFNFLEQNVPVQFFRDDVYIFLMSWSPRSESGRAGLCWKTPSAGGSGGEGGPGPPLLYVLDRKRSTFRWMPEAHKTHPIFPIFFGVVVVVVVVVFHVFVVFSLRCTTRLSWFWLWLSRHWLTTPGDTACGAAGGCGVLLVVVGILTEKKKNSRCDFGWYNRKMNVIPSCTGVVLRYHTYSSTLYRIVSHNIIYCTTGVSHHIIPIEPGLIFYFYGT